MIVVCYPINPFGTVQTREELLVIADINSERQRQRSGELFLPEAPAATPEFGEQPTGAEEGATQD